MVFQSFTAATSQQVASRNSRRARETAATGEAESSAAAAASGKGLLPVALISSYQEPASVRGEGLWMMYLSCPLALELDVNWMLLLMSCFPSGNFGGHPVYAIAHWQMHSTG